MRVADIKSTTSTIKHYKTKLNNQEDWIRHQRWEDREMLMNIEASQATRSKHELHVEREQKLTLLSP